MAMGVGIVVGQLLAPKPKPMPSEPLGKLKYGNELFAKGNYLPPKVDELTRYKLATEKPHPLAVVVISADPRVAPEVLFNRELGELFVVRTFGNVVDETMLASIEYAVEHLKVPLIVVVGHVPCELVKAVVSGKRWEGRPAHLLSQWETVLREVKATHPHLKGEALEKRLVQAHVRYVLRTLLERSAVIQTRHKMGKLELAGGVYHLREGKVEWLEDPKTHTMEAARHASKASHEPHESAAHH